MAAMALAGCGRMAEGQLQRLDDYRVSQAVSAYETARTRGALIDMCVKAKLAAIAYGEARDVSNRRAWEAREKEDCRAALAAAGG